MKECCKQLQFCAQCGSLLRDDKMPELSKLMAEILDEHQKGDNRLSPFGEYMEFAVNDCRYGPLTMLDSLKFVQELIRAGRKVPQVDKDGYVTMRIPKFEIEYQRFPSDVVEHGYFHGFDRSLGHPRTQNDNMTGEVIAYQKRWNYDNDGNRNASRKPQTGSSHEAHNATAQSTSDDAIRPAISDHGAVRSVSEATSSDATRGRSE